MLQQQLGSPLWWCRTWRVIKNLQQGRTCSIHERVLSNVILNTHAAVVELSSFPRERAACVSPTRLRSQQDRYRIYINASAPDISLRCDTEGLFVSHIHTRQVISCLTSSKQGMLFAFTLIVIPAPRVRGCTWKCSVTIPYATSLGVCSLGHGRPAASAATEVDRATTYRTNNSKSSLDLVGQEHTAAVLQSILKE